MKFSICWNCAMNHCCLVVCLPVMYASTSPINSCYSDGPYPIYLVLSHNQPSHHVLFAFRVACIYLNESYENVPDISFDGARMALTVSTSLRMLQSLMRRGVGVRRGVCTKEHTPEAE